ncbi:MAG: helix-turn-helix transcriptional regulator [Methylococcales bacterium]|nr:helix-turn-helix transcriptional regulator [Methylococcales bacterium]
MNNRIKALRIKNGLNQSQLGDILGIGQKAVSMIEKGINQPTKPQIEALSEYFNVSTDYLFFGYETVKPSEREILQTIREDKSVYAAIMRVVQSKNELNQLAA